MNFMALWLGLPQWARDAIKIAGVILAIIFLGKVYIKAKQDEAVQKNNEKRDKEAAEVQAEVVSNITENSNEIVRESDAVRSHSPTVVLSDGTQGLPQYHYRD